MPENLDPSCGNVSPHCHFIEQIKAALRKYKRLMNAFSVCRTSHVWPSVEKEVKMLNHFPQALGWGPPLLSWFALLGLYHEDTTHQFQTITCCR